MDYRKKLEAAASLDRMAPGSRLARTVAKGAARDALEAGATCEEFTTAVREAGVSWLQPETVYSIAWPMPGWECAR